MTERLDGIKDHLGDHQDIHEDDGWWLVWEVERLREERDGLRDSIRDWRASHDVAANEAQRASGLEAAARSAFAEVERLRGLLARLEWFEWSGTLCSSAGEQEAACPVCDHTPAEGHATGAHPLEEPCWLAAALRGDPPEGPPAAEGPTPRDVLGLPDD